MEVKIKDTFRIKVNTFIINRPIFKKMQDSFTGRINDFNENMKAHKRMRSTGKSKCGWINVKKY